MQARGREALARRLLATPREAMAVVRGHAALGDLLVRAALQLAVAQAGGPGEAPAGAPLALIATGGWGRGEMAPWSDLDLLFLTPGPVTGDAARIIEAVLYTLWDLHLKVGHASRSLDECVALAREDMTIRTGLLDLRPVAGDRALAQRLRERLRREVLTLPPAPFIAAKLAEREARHRRHGGQRFMLEPDVKEGKGALRDLQSLYWIAAHVAAGMGAEEGGQVRLFSRDERATFDEAARFLWAVRCHLHLLAGRAADRLTFDAQPEVAARMGYDGPDTGAVVARFMHDYYREATRVGDLTRILLAALEERRKLPAPLLAPRRRAMVPRAPFGLRLNRLRVADRAAFLADPVNLIAAFEEAQRVGARLHPETLRLIAANIDRIDSRLRHDPQAGRLFLSLLTRHGRPEHALRRMNETGALGAFIPEFGAVAGMMPANMYHHYTVDEHTIQALGHLARIERGEMEAALPVTSAILRRGVNRRVLHVALLLHDCGKALPGDHSLTGAGIARRVAPRLGLHGRDAAMVEWLVRHHLLMSDMAQKRDVADPQTLRGFLAIVDSRERLDLLTVLTVCDISAVGPGVWNNWKAELLRLLWNAAAAALAGDGATPAGGVEAAQRALRAALPDWSEDKLEAEMRRHTPGYWLGLPGATHAAFARLLRDTRPQGTGLLVTLEPARDAMRICITMPDAPGLFARIAGAVARARADVVEARSWTTRDLRATATFRVQDAQGLPWGPEAVAELEARIRRALAAPPGPLPRRAPPPRMRERATAVTFDDAASASCTVIEVDTADRPFLLHDLARTISDAGVQIVSAVIATYGEQAVDTFYVRDRFGEKLAPGPLRERLAAALQGAARG